MCVCVALAFVDRGLRAPTVVVFRETLECVLSYIKPAVIFFLSFSLSLSLSLFGDRDISAKRAADRSASTFCFMAIS